MSPEPTSYQVRRLLADLDEKIREAERALWAGGAEAHIKPAGELTFLKRQKESLQSRLHELEMSRGSAMETVLRWFNEEGMLLHYRLDDWIVGARRWDLRSRPDAATRRPPTRDA